MIYGIGCDIIEISRIRKVYERYGRQFLKRIYKEEEIEYCLSRKDPSPSFAARFAAKEAMAKALGVGIGSLFSWHDSYITIDSKGKPQLLLSDLCQSHFGTYTIHTTLSHSESCAMAVIVLERIERDRY